MYDISKQGGPSSKQLADKRNIIGEETLIWSLPLKSDFDGLILDHDRIILFYFIAPYIVFDNLGLTFLVSYTFSITYFGLLLLLNTS